MMQYSKISFHFSQHTHQERIHSFHRNRRHLQWWRRGFLTLLAVTGLGSAGYGLYTGYHSWVFSLARQHVDARFLKKEGVSGLTFHAQDQQKRPIVVQAVQASEIAEQPMHYTLVQPQGTIDFQDGRQLFIESQSGLVNKNNRHITMTERVHSYDTLGYVMRTEQMFFDPEHNQTHGTCYVEGEGPTSSWTGQGFIYNWEAEYLQLQGPATLTLMPQP